MIFISVFPSFFKKEDILSISLIDLILNIISDTGLLNKSLSEDIFSTLILLNLFSSLEIFFASVITNELPSTNISLFDSKISEKINSSNTLVKSVNLITA